jgi:hypothetical protein
MDITSERRVFMKSRIALLTVCFVLAGLAVAYAADVNGKWVAQIPGRDGQTRELTINLKVEGDKLTGTVSGRGGDSPFTDGKINGDDISFTVTSNFNGTEVKNLYKGKVAGDEIKFTRTRDGGDQPAQEFTAKRSK